MIRVLQHLNNYAAFAVLAIVASSSAAAQTSSHPQWNACLGRDGASPAVKISSCTAVIQAAKDRPQTLSIAWSNRGNAYREGGDYDRAFQDLEQAIRIDRRNSGAYYNRALVYIAKSDIDHAIRDFDQAI